MSDKTILQNKRAFFDYHIEERFEAGIVLEGWEVKGLRAGSGHLSEAYALIKNMEIFLLNASIQPPKFATKYIPYQSSRTRKLLLHKREILKILSLTQRSGFTLVPLKIYWAGPYIKCELGLAKGKKQADKRAALAEKDWEREKARMKKSFDRGS